MFYIVTCISRLNSMVGMVYADDVNDAMKKAMNLFKPEPPFKFELLPLTKEYMEDLRTVRTLGGAIFYASEDL